MAKVTFDGPTKIISVNSGITTIDVKTDLYSDWKEWVLLLDNSKYAPAFRAVGGDEISAGLYLTGSYFLTNGWKIRPDEADHVLKVIGNLYVDGEDTSPFIPTLGTYNVSIQLNTSNIVNTVAVGSGVTNQDKTDIIDGVKIALDDDMKTILGLVHQNFKFFNQVYDSDGNLESGTVEIYNTAGDLALGTTPMKTYNIVATYVGKKLVNYQMILS